MSSPKPKVPLTGQCSVIRDNTLYVYSADAFQSLPLTKHAKWSTLEHGVPVSGAACALMQDSGEDALWVIGGTSKDTDYPGLQQYSFTTNKWTSVTPLVPVTKDRQGHVATPLPGASAVLVYSGSQDNNPLPSVETFLISTKAPYGVQSYTSHNVPGTLPLLLPWNGTSAITIGGASDNTDVFMFQSSGSGGEWSKYKTQLKEPLKVSSQQQATILDGSDNSKVLEIFDMSVSPANVERIVLQDANGKPAAAGQTVGGPQAAASGQQRRRRRRRDLTLNSWPSYNKTFAPTTTRTDFAVAQGLSGMVAIVGGNSQNPVQLFNGDKNSWVDTKEFFGLQSVIAQTASSTSSTSTTTSSTTTLSSTSAMITPTSTPPPISHHPHTSRDLGAILGAILGFIAVLIIILALLAWRRRKLRRRRSQEEEDEKHRLSFADRGAPFMKEAGGAVSYPKDSRFDSMAMVGNQPMSNHRRSATHGSDSSTAKLVPTKGNAFGMNDAVEMEVIREKSWTPTGKATLEVPKNNLSAKPKRSSGWSRYFSGTDGLSIQSKSPRNSQRPPSSRQSATGARKSLGAQSTGSVHDCSSHGPTEIPPLELGQQFAESKLRESVGDAGMAGHRRHDTAQSRPNTLSRSSSTFSSLPGSLAGDLALSDDRQDDESTQWTPVTGSTWNASRPRDTGASSVYDMNDLSSIRKSSLHQPSSVVYSDLRASSNPFLAATTTGNAAKRPSIVNPTTVATSIVIPAPASNNAAPPPAKAMVNSDASWLNLGAVSSRGV